MESLPLETRERDIKQLIVSALNLEEVAPEDIDSEAPLFVDGLGLDSIDALELGLALQKRYDVSFGGDSQETRKHFASVRALALFVGAQEPRARA